MKKGFTKAFWFDIILRLTMFSINSFPEKGMFAERESVR